METIKIYVENVFSSLPKTQDFINLKTEMLTNMEEKYNELKASGKTENESIGIVISEFGNIDELIKEMGLNTESSNADTQSRNMSHEEVETYLSKNHLATILVAIGVFICIMTPAVFVLISTILENNFDIVTNQNMIDSIPIVIFFCMIAVAVGLFIYAGYYISDYKYIKNGDFEINTSTRVYLQQKYNSVKPVVTLFIIVGVLLCILSVLPIIVMNALYETDFVSGISVFIFLSTIAVAVFLFIYFGDKEETYKRLLHEDEYAKKSVSDDRVISIVASIVWPLTVVGYLVWSFIGNAWNISWLIWPIVGILFGCFSSAYHGIKNNN